MLKYGASGTLIASLINNRFHNIVKAGVKSKITKQIKRLRD